MLMDTKAVSQRYFVSHIKELREPVAVTVQEKGSGGTIKTIGYFFPITTINSDDIARLKRFAISDQHKS